MDYVKRSKRLRILFWASLAASLACASAMVACNPTTTPMAGDFPWLMSFLGFGFVSAVAAQ